MPDRESETLAKWLKAHPGIEIATRDRSRAYAEAIADGAPDAVQIADRWRILKNLYEALERLVHSKKSVLCMKTVYIGCHEADFHFEVAI
jgi:transposase